MRSKENAESCVEVQSGDLRGAGRLWRLQENQVAEGLLVQRMGIYLVTRTPFSSLHKHLWHLDEIPIL